MLYLSDLKKFFKERPTLSISGISKEAGASSRMLSLVLDGDRRLTEGFSERLEPVLIKYGYDFRKRQWDYAIEIAKWLLSENKPVDQNFIGEQYPFVNQLKVINESLYDQLASKGQIDEHSTWNYFSTLIKFHLAVEKRKEKD